jgi:hypothetical protein
MMTRNVRVEAGAHQNVLPCILGFARQTEHVRVRGGLKSAEGRVTLIARRSQFLARKIKLSSTNDQHPV